MPSDIYHLIYGIPISEEFMYEAAGQYLLSCKKHELMQNLEPYFEGIDTNNLPTSLDEKVDILINNEDFMDYLCALYDIEYFYNGSENVNYYFGEKINDIGIHKCIIDSISYPESMFKITEKEKEKINDMINHEIAWPHNINIPKVGFYWIHGTT